MTNPTISGDLIPITPGETEEYQQNFNIVYAGKVGTKKTTYAASWPDPLFVYTDRNLGALLKHKVPYVTIRDWNFFYKQVIPLLKAREWVDSKGERVPFPYRTLVFDTMSSLSDLCYDHYSNLWGEKDKSFKFWDSILAGQMRVVRMATELSAARGEHPGCHVVFTSHIKDKENELGRIIGTKLDIWGKAALNITKVFDDIFLCDKKTDKEGEEGFWVWTKNPPNTKIDFVKEIIGDGNGGELPVKVGGSYPELMKAWGVEEDG